MALETARFNTGNGRPEHRALCPGCGRLACSEQVLRTGGVSESCYLCPRGHIWLTKWNPAA
jgi:hypothetical protein